jgi:hypothetical protein
VHTANPVITETVTTMGYTGICVTRTPMPGTLKVRPLIPWFKLSTEVLIQVAPFGRNLIPYVHLEPYFLPAFYANRRLFHLHLHLISLKLETMSDIPALRALFTAWCIRGYSDHATDLITERIIALQTTTPVVCTSVPHITFDC